jgi:hypothetical protein
METLRDYLNRNGKIKVSREFQELKETQKVQKEIITPLPKFNCCCCQDKGTISKLIAQQFMELIEGYSVIPCTRCDVARDKGLLELTPYSVPVEICEILHQQNKKTWDEFTVEDVKKAKSLLNAYIQKFNTF